MYNIKKIDFLKSDCEGGEYDIFNEENFEWIIKNVKKISGEWHLHNSSLKNKFKKFRDLYLKHFTNFEIESIAGGGQDTNSIKWWVFDDGFIEYYIINVYIDNRIEPYIAKK